MSNKTTTEWQCVQCEKTSTSPAWLAKTRQFCTRQCSVSHKLKVNPDYFSKIGAKANRLKISQTLKEKGLQPPSRKGTTATETTRLKMSESQKLWYAKGNTRTKGRKLNISPEGLERKIKATQKTRRNLAKKGKLTDIEAIVDKFLQSKEIEYINEYPIGRKVVDFYIPSQNLIIEADGEYWHQDKEKDSMRDTYIKEKIPGVNIIRLTGQTIKNGTWVDNTPWGAKRGV